MADFGTPEQMVASMQQMQQQMQQMQELQQTIAAQQLAAQREPPVPIGTTDAAAETERSEEDQQEVSYVNGQGWQFKSYHPNPNVRNNPHLFLYKTNPDNLNDRSQGNQFQNTGYQKPYFQNQNQNQNQNGTMISLDEVSIVSEDRLDRGHLALGLGRPAPRLPRPWARTARAEEVEVLKRQVSGEEEQRVAREFEIRDLKKKIKDLEKVAEASSADALAVNQKNQELQEDIEALKAAAETFKFETMMAVNGARVVARWELMREWLRKQSAQWDLVTALEQYKAVVREEARSKGLELYWMGNGCGNQNSHRRDLLIGGKPS
ncbi:hypothetical protein DY000_02040569 [Brassica cretica]|uniref:Uncharacterized protein n=1 Tax=Brassica cretica TaxID=69181 RepID=A0ABQ7BA59_BRACR|nr:hypothetical protein DY000_02040569 [Brassica cretica]